MTYIALADCRHGWTYEIHSRNLVFGVFDSKAQGFIGIREKFGDLFLFTEFHWDTGAPYGTVKPKKELEECPIKDLRERFETICFECKKPVHWVRNDNHGPATGDWLHVEDPGTCLQILTGSGKFGSPENKELFKYLEDVEKRLRRHDG